MDKKKIGLLGGFSYESTLQYYDKLMQMYYTRYHDYHYPELVIYSMDFQKFTDMENENRMADYRAYILQAIGSLAAAGADFVAMTANSPHSVYDAIAPCAPVPLVSIVEAVAQDAVSRGMKRVLLTGIRYTMRADFYPVGLAKYGIEVIVPDEVDQAEIDRMIFEELCIGILREETRQRFLEIIRRYPADGVILGCTELPLLVRQSDTEIPLIHSVDVHCAAILRAALETA